VSLFDKIMNKFRNKSPDEHKKVLRPKTEYEEDIELLSKFQFDDLCSSCVLAGNCKEFYSKSGIEPCKSWSVNFDENKKKNMLLIDDDPGVISTINDIINELIDEGEMRREEWNILVFTTKQAGIMFLKSLRDENFKIDVAIIDITFGSILRIFNKNIKINGVHIFYFLYERNTDLKFMFYTGNPLNEYITSKKELREFFFSTKKKPISDYIVSKLSSDDDEIKDRIKVLVK